MSANQWFVNPIFPGVVTSENGDIAIGLYRGMPSQTIHGTEGTLSEITSDEAIRRVVLMSAAPELLEVLEDACAYPIGGSWQIKARAAIAKAKGEQP